MQTNDLFKLIADDFRQAKIFTLNGAPFGQFSGLLAEWRDPPNRPDVPELALFFDGMSRSVVAAPLAASSPHLLYLDFNCYCARDLDKDALPVDICRAHLASLADSLLDETQWAQPSNQPYLVAVNDFVASLSRLSASAASSLA